MRAIYYINISFVRTIGILRKDISWSALYSQLDEILSPHFRKWYLNSFVQKQDPVTFRPISAYPGVNFSSKNKEGKKCSYH